VYYRNNCYIIITTLLHFCEQIIPFSIPDYTGEGYGPVSSQNLANVAVELRQFDKKADKDWLLSLLRQHKRIKTKEDKGGFAHVLHPSQLILLLRDKQILMTKAPDAADKALFERCLQAYDRIARLECLRAHSALTVYGLFKTFICMHETDLQVCI
jgi:hypothetical protein